MIKAELKNFTSDKFYMLIRAGSVALRMCFPVLVLILGSEEDLGRYYLINAAIVLVLFTLTFESGVFFARKKSRSGSVNFDAQYLWQIVNAQILFFIFLGGPAIILIAQLFIGLDFKILIFVLLYLASEAVVNEFGKYFISTNAPNRVAWRDFSRATFSLVAGYCSLITVGGIVTWQYFALFGLFNLSLATIEIKIAVKPKLATLKGLDRKRYHFAIFSSVISNARGMITQSGLGYAYPLLERLLLERALGLGMVGAYVLVSTAFNSVFAVILLPNISRIRSLVVLHFKSASIWNDIRGETRALIRKNVFFGILIICLIKSVFYIFPEEMEGSKLNLSNGFLFSALVSVISSNIISIFSPDFASTGNWVSSTVKTGLIYTSSLLSLMIIQTYFLSLIWLFPIIMVLGYTFQIVVRRKYFI